MQATPFDTRVKRRLHPLKLLLTQQWTFPILGHQTHSITCVVTHVECVMSTLLKGNDMPLDENKLNSLVQKVIEGIGAAFQTGDCYTHH
jgi:hypothetical protein